MEYCNGGDLADYLQGEYRLEPSSSESNGGHPYCLYSQCTSLHYQLGSDLVQGFIYHIALFFCFLFGLPYAIIWDKQIIWGY